MAQRIHATKQHLSSACFNGRRLPNTVQSFAFSMSHERRTMQGEIANKHTRQIAISTAIGVISYNKYPLVQPYGHKK